MTDGERASRRAGVRREHEPARLIEPSQKHTCRDGGARGNSKRGGHAYNAVDVREKRIAAELADADAKKAEAPKERDEFQHKNEEFDQQRAALLNKATDEAKAERQRLLDDFELKCPPTG